MPLLLIRPQKLRSCCWLADTTGVVLALITSLHLLLYCPQHFGVDSFVLVPLLLRHALVRERPRPNVPILSITSLPWACSSHKGNDSSNETRNEDSSTVIPSIRLNKVFKATHSRRDADRMIQEGRVMVNGKVSFGDMVIPFVDEISLDGTNIKNWEAMNGIVAEVLATSTDNNDPATSGRPAMARVSNQLSATPTTQPFEYVKYYKPQGVICTTDQRIKDNIIDALTQTSGYRPKHRVYPVGRLDKDSTGLILITSDGRLPNASLRHSLRNATHF